VKTKGIKLTLEQADAHQRRHGFKPLLPIDLQQSIDEAARLLAENDPTLVKKPRKLREPPQMNKGEREFSFILEAQKRLREISRWEHHAITLQWGGVRYTPDLDVWVKGVLKRFIEIKGGFLGHGDAIVKFKLAREHWPEFEWEMWQKERGQWNRLL
jgi:hypothetical protein